jgi:hypothetical protein
MWYEQCVNKGHFILVLYDAISSTIPTWWPCASVNKSVKQSYIVHYFSVLTHLPTIGDHARDTGSCGGTSV